MGSKGGKEMSDTKYIYHVVEEKDGVYNDRLAFQTYEEALEFIRFIRGRFIILNENELDDFITDEEIHSE